MPYYITDKAPSCDGWATVKDDGEVLGCHTTKQAAIDQMVAVSVAEELEPGGERAKPNELKEGDFVSWNSSGGRARGRIEYIMKDGTLGIPDSDFSIKATPDDPAALIRIYKEVAGGWDETEILVGHKFSTLTKINPLPYEEEDEDKIGDESDEKRKVNLSAPAYMRAAARRGLELNRQGFGGDGLTDKTKQEARDMAAGRVSEDKWRRIAPWIARHLVDLDAPKNSNPDDPNYPGAGLVAHLLWGSGPTRARAIAAMNYAENVVEKLNENRHLPGGHEQLAHGSGAGGGYKSGAWKKANESDKQAILERQYGQAADLAQGNLSREQKINSLAKMDNNDDLLKAEVYINGTHSVAFKGTSKSIDSETKQEILKDVDNLQTIAPLDSLQVDVVARIPSNVAKNPNLKVSGYTHSNGKKIVLMKDAAADRDTLAGTKIQLADPDWHMPTYRNTVSKGTYTLSHEWGHAVDLQKNKSGTLDFENKVDMAVKRGLSSGGFISKYGKTNLSEAYAEGFAEFVSTNKSTNNPVVAELAKEFSW